MNLDKDALLDQEAAEYACFGAGLPADAERELHLAGMVYHEDGIAETHLRNAIKLAPWPVLARASPMAWQKNWASGKFS